MSRTLLKVEGAGNDFLIGIGEWAPKLAGDPILVARLCDRRRGVGADGALALVAESSGSVRVTYRNADGSPSPFCGNGTRCAARVAVDVLGLNPRLVVGTDWAEVPAEVVGSLVTLDLPGLAAAPRSVELESHGQRWRGRVLEVGVPHLVVAVADVGEVEMSLQAPSLRRHRQLGPGGANVSFISHGRDRTVHIRTFERGVEAETLCCGSAVVAAGVVEMVDRGVRRVALRARSGDELTVEAKGDPLHDRVLLIGPTRMIATVEPASDLLDSFAIEERVTR